MSKLKFAMLAVLLGPAAILPYENTISAYVGAGDGYDIRYDRYFGNFGVGVSPSLGTILYSKVIWNSDRSELAWYAPAIHLGYRMNIYKDNFLIPELKMAYNHWNDRDVVDRKNKNVTSYGILPRISYSIPFNHVCASLYAGMFGFLVHHWNDAAQEEYRPLPVDGFTFGLPALGASVGYIF